MATEITVVHLSDLHARLSDEEGIKRRVEALFEDLTREDVHPDLILFSGDIAHSGKAEEFELADSLLFQPMFRRFHISAKRAFAVPGNHDVDRTTIDLQEDNFLAKALKTSEDAQHVFEKHGTARLSACHAFTEQKLAGMKAPFSAHTVPLHGFDVGVACFNSAWRCAGDKDKGRLFLTSKQVAAAAEALDKCLVKIAMVHHPFHWFHPGEDQVIEDLKRSFEIILTGHLHEQVSIAEQTTSHNSLFLTVPALFAGFGNWEGYNIYRINVEDRKFTVHFRKFIKKRAAFDRDTAHAQDGRHEFALPVRSISKMTRAVMVQRIDACKNRLQLAIKEQLQLIQKVPNPVLVTPKISRVAWSGGTRTQFPLERTLLEITATNAVIFGPSDSGKTILLESLAADLSASRVMKPDERMALYIDFGLRQTFSSKEELEAFMDQVAGKELPGEALQKCVILADNLGEKGVQTIELLKTAASERDLILVLAVGSDLMFEALGSKEDTFQFEFYEMGYWGPSRIREFVVKYFEGTEIDVDAAYNFVSASLEDTDLPATPWLVALYLSIFPTVGKQVSSLSFVRLLERIEEHRLGQIETSSADSLYNKREILMRMACECLKKAKLGMERAAFEDLVRGFFKAKFLDVDIDKFLLSLQESGFIHACPSEVRFTYFAFYDYFLAKAFERKITDVDAVVTSLPACISVGQALSLYGGLFRDNVSVAKRVLGFVRTAFKERQVYTTKDLDKYINDLLVEKDNKHSADQIADADLKRKVEYAKDDEDFDKRKLKRAQGRSLEFQAKEPTCRIEELGTAIAALKTFYNLFRNLENIDGREKVQLLEEILDFHINLNLGLIDFFSSLKPASESEKYETLTAYIVTLGGQMFLSSNIGNQSLQEAITEAIETCSNDLKKLLLVCLYSDLRLHGYQKTLEDYVVTSDSMAAVELIYLQTRKLMITHDSRQVPASLISAFQAAFRRRHELYGDASTRGAFSAKGVRDGTYDRMYSAAIEETKRQHMSFFNAKEALLRANIYS